MKTEIQFKAEGNRIKNKHQSYGVYRVTLDEKNQVVTSVKTKVVNAMVSDKNLSVESKRVRLARVKNRSWIKELMV